MHLTQKWCLPFFVVVAGWLSTPAFATVSPGVAYSTIEGLGGYDFSTARAINGSAFMYGYQAHASAFVSQASGIISSIELAVHYTPYLSSPDDQVNFNLVLDYFDPVYGHLPSTTSIVSGTVGTPTPFGSSGLVTFTPSTAVSLVLGQAYWLEVTPGSANTVADWNVSTTTSGPVAISLDGTTWLQNPSDPQEAFRIQVVPEPATPVLVGLGLLGLAYGSIRRNQPA